MLKRIDLRFSVIVLVLSLASLIALYSISYGTSQSTNYFGKQLMWVLIGISLFFTLQIIDLKSINNYIYPIYLVTIFFAFKR